MGVCEVILRKGGRVNLLGSTGRYIFELNKSVPIPDTDELLLQKLRNLIKLNKNRFELTEDLLPEVIPKGWERLVNTKLRVLALRVGLTDADNTKVYPTRKSVQLALQKMVDLGRVTESND